MKKILLLLMLICITISSIGQTATYKNEIITVVLNNGTNTPKNVQFKVDSCTFNLIKNSNEFLDYKKDRNIDIKLKNNNLVIKCIESNIMYYYLLFRVNSLYTFKYPSSFDFVDGSIGRVEFINNRIYVSFYYMLQNGFGNYITQYVTIFINDNGDAVFM